jgi:SAM-dependent methyltransferase
MLRRIFLFRLSKLPCGSHITRYSMYRQLDGMFAGAARDCRVLCISDSGGLVTVLGLADADVVRVDYPEHSLLALYSFEDGAFDFVVSDQVLEHVEGDPRRAFDESHRVLKPGGVAVHTTCFINPIHEYPVDLWRFTPYALGHLASAFPEVETGGWGNRGVWFIEWLGLRYMPVPHATWHPLNKVATHDNPLWPVSTWVVARK